MIIIDGLRVIRLRAGSWTRLEDGVLASQPAGVGLWIREIGRSWQDGYCWEFRRVA